MLRRLYSRLDDIVIWLYMYALFQEHVRVKKAVQ